MAKMLFVDVDGHILEPANLWLDYIEPKFRDRAMRVDTDLAGLECWSVDGKPIPFFSSGTAADAASIGKDQKWRRENIFDSHEVSWEDGLEMTRPAWKPDHRIALMDDEEIDGSFLFPTLGLTLSRIEDKELSAVHCTAYNNWIRDFCARGEGRLFPALTLPWGDVQRAVVEAKRTADFGARAVQAPNTPPKDMSYGRLRWDPLWAEMVYQGLPVSLHVGNAGTTSGSILYPEFTLPSWWDLVTGPMDSMLSFVSFFQGGVFDRFPKLKVVVLEAGAAWLPWLLIRMDEMHELMGFTAESKKLPTEYFSTQCWVSVDPGDELGQFTIEQLGASRILWAFDYPHSDGGKNPVRNLRKLLQGFTPRERRQVSGENAVELFGLE